MTQRVLQRVEERRVDEQPAPGDRRREAPGHRAGGEEREVERIDDRPDPEGREHQQVGRQEAVGGGGARSHGSAPPAAARAAAGAARRVAHSAIGRPVTSSICLAASSSAAWALSKPPFRYCGLHHLHDLVGVAEERRAADRLDLVERAEHHLPDRLVAPERQRLLDERILERGEERGHEAVLPQHRHLALVGAERVVRRRPRPPPCCRSSPGSPATSRRGWRRAGRRRSCSASGRRPTCRPGPRARWCGSCPRTRRRRAGSPRCRRCSTGSSRPSSPRSSARRRPSP